MKLFTHTLFFFLLVTQICFGQWYQQNSGTTKSLNAIYFFDENNGWAVGDSGLIIYTSNGGTDWAEQISGVDLTLRDIFFIDASKGWAVGDSGKTIGTINGGTDWSQQISGTTLYLSAVCFINETTGWVAAYDWYGPYEILKTTSGGSNWTAQTIIPNNPAEKNLNDVYFIDENIGFTLGGGGNIGGFYGHFFRTTNGGDTWNEQNGFEGIGLKCISFSDTLNGIMVGEGYGMFGNGGRVFRTNDGGINWLEADSAGHSLNSVAFTDLNHAWAVGLDSWPSTGTILFSSDSGISWSRQVIFSVSLNSIFFINSSTGWAVGDSGTVLHTTNGGVTFVEEEEINEILTTYFLNNNFPNPFNPSTTIRYSIPTQSKVVMKVYDILGTEIATLMDEEKPVGTYELTWNAKNLPSGVYFYQLKAGNYIESKKMILLK